MTGPVAWVFMAIGFLSVAGTTLIVVLALLSSGVDKAVRWWDDRDRGRLVLDARLREDREVADLDAVWELS